MASYRIEFKKSVKKDFRHLPQRDVLQILGRIRGLADKPRSSQSKKMSGQEKYRLRQGQYRILYEIRDQLLLITIVKVRHRKEVYRML